MRTLSILASCLTCTVSLAACGRDFSDGGTSSTNNRGEKDDRETTTTPDTADDVESESAVGADAASETDVARDAHTNDGDTSNAEPDSDADPDVEPPPNTVDGNSPDWSAAFDGVYDFEQSGADLGQDTSGRGHDLQLVGSPERDADHAHGGFSALFDNGDPEEMQYLGAKVEFADTLESPSVTIGAWIKTPLVIGNSDYSIAANGHQYAGGISLRVRLDLLAVRCLVAANLEAVVVDDVYVADYRVWKHIVCRYDNDAKKLHYFVDGEASDHSTDVPDGIGQGTGEFRIGEGFTGAVDEVFFIKKALTDEEVARIWACGVNGQRCDCSPSDPAAYETCGSLQDCANASLPPCDYVIPR